MQKLKEALLHRFVTHADPEAFTEMVRQHAGLVYGACLRILGDEDKAADAAQETFFQMLRNAGQITGSLSGWLHRAATCRAIDRLRRDSTRRQHEIKYSVEHPRHVEQWEEISPWIDEELDQLDEQTREVLVRHYFNRQTTREIGAELGISQSTVSRRMETGLDLLRNRLSKRGLVVAAAALGVLLGQNAAQAAPAVMMTELGKMALIAGTGSVITSGAGAATVSAGEAATGGILAGVKAKVITAAAVAVIGAGSVVTYNHFSNHPESTETAVVESQSGEQSSRKTNVPSKSQKRAGSNITYIEGDSESLPAARQESTDTDDFDEWFDSIFADAIPPGGQSGQAGSEGTATEGGMMGGGMGGGTWGMMGGTQADSETTEEEVQEEAVYYYGGARRARVRVAPPPEDPEENDEEQ